MSKTLKERVRHLQEELERKRRLLQKADQSTKFRSITASARSSQCTPVDETRGTGKSNLEVSNDDAVDIHPKYLGFHKSLFDEHWLNVDSVNCVPIASKSSTEAFILGVITEPPTNIVALYLALIDPPLVKRLWSKRFVNREIMFLRILPRSLDDTSSAMCFQLGILIIERLYISNSEHSLLLSIYVFQLSHASTIAAHLELVDVLTVPIPDSHNVELLLHSNELAIHLFGSFQDRLFCAIHIPVSNLQLFELFSYQSNCFTLRSFPSVKLETLDDLWCVALGEVEMNLTRSAILSLYSNVNHADLAYRLWVVESDQLNALCTFAPISIDGLLTELKMDTEASGISFCSRPIMVHVTESSKPLQSLKFLFSVLVKPENVNNSAFDSNFILITAIHLTELQTKAAVIRVLSVDSSDLLYQELLIKPLPLHRPKSSLSILQVGVSQCNQLRVSLLCLGQTLNSQHRLLLHDKVFVDNLDPEVRLFILHFDCCRRTPSISSCYDTIIVFRQRSAVNKFCISSHL